jgi:RHS repeat-associated protein
MCLVGPFDGVVSAQTYLTATGVSGFSSPYPAEMGTVDATSGNLHLEIPLGSFPQRGSGALIPKLVYDSHIWTVPTDGTSYVWTTQGALYGLAYGTWGMHEGGSAGTYYIRASGSGCNVDYMLWGESGVQHYFNIPGTLNGTTCSGGTAYAVDSSGFQMRQTPWNNQGLDAVISVYAPDGTEVWGGDLYTKSIAAKDPNGNYLGLTSANILPPGIYNPVVDTLGRKIVNPLAYSNPMTLQVTNSEGATSDYVITTATIPLNTDFGQSGIAECTTQNNCSAEVITSIALPDGTSYSFLYDCDETTGNAACNSPGGQSGYYGTLTSMSLPSGATITYYYQNFKDALGNLSRWLSVKEGPDGGWTYFPTVTGGTSQQVSVLKPDGSQDVINFTVDSGSGAWPTNILSYDTGGVTLLSTVNNTWDFSIACQLNVCGGKGHQDIRKLSTSTTFPVPGGSITKQTTYTYDTPQTGNITAIKEWKYQAGTSPTFPAVPDRATYTTYATIGTNNDINHPLTKTICNNSGSDANCPGGGTTVARTVNTYDAYGTNGSLALASVTGVENHDDTNFGTGYTARGNVTQIAQLSGSTYLTTAISYDTTGQVTQVLDPNQNATTLSYADSFYDDNGANPPAAHSGAPKTNAYVTKVTDSIGSTSAGYYYGSGQKAITSDYNSVPTYSHYVDPLDRPTETNFPIGWVLTEYGLPIQGETAVDSYSAVSDTTASSSCVGCAHTQSLLDSLGRPITQSLVNNPAGQAYVYTIFDSLNRAALVSHPNFGSSDPNDVYETTSYDGLGRSRGVTHPDQEKAQVFYGSAVTQVWGALTSQRGSSTSYGLGFPVVSVDEANKDRQEWIDGFGRIIEVDEPSTGPTPSVGSFGVFGQDEYVYIPNCGPPACQEWNSGTVTVTINGKNYTADYYGCYVSQTPPGNTPAQIASSLVSQINADTTAVVTATANGGTVSLQSKGTGSGVNYSLSASSASTCTQYFSNSAFGANPSGSDMTGGSNSGAILSTPNVTNYTYDVSGNLTSVVQGVQNRSYRYDGLSRLTQETTPEAGTVTLSYVTSTGALCSGDPSKPCTRTAPAPNVTTGTVTTTYTYNKANQLTNKAHSDTTGTETYTYGTSASGFNVGRLTKMTDPSGSEAYTYDKGGRVLTLTKVVGSTTYTTKFAYNSGGQLTKLTYPSARVVGYNYDNVGHLCQVGTTTNSNCSGATPYLTLLSGNYDAAGRLLSATYGNGVVATAAYSPQTLELSGLSYAKSTTTLFGQNYYYQQNSTYCPSGNALGNNGQIQCIADISSGTGDSGRSAAYTYDALGRLLTATTTGSAQYPLWGLSWTYDRYANRTAQTVTAGSGYSSSLIINPVNNEVTSPAFTYDAGGNVIKVPAPLSASYTYDGEECNTGYTGVSSAATYTCDGNRLRVKKVVTGTDAVTTVYIRSRGQVIAEYDNGAAVTSPTREYLYANSLMATVTGSTGGSGGTILYLHHDHRSPRLYTDVNGNDVGEQGTFPFGESWYSNNTTSSWVFTSYERDQESGNDYALARSYADGQGRFLAPDPREGWVGDPQSWNRYAYVLNDPINLSDPNGQGFWEDLGLAIASIFVDIFLPELAPEILTAAADAGQAAQDIRLAKDVANAVIAGIAIWYWSDDTHSWHRVVPGTGGNTIDIDNGNNGPPGGSAPAGGGGPVAGGGGTDPGNNGAGDAGPGGGGGGDVAVENDIWHESAACPNCGKIWGQADSTVKDLAAGYAVIYSGILAGPTIIAAGARAGGLIYGYLGTAGTVVLGSGSDYLEKAEEIGGAALKAPNWVYNGLLRTGNWWDFNQGFLDGSIARGANFITATQVFSARAGGYLLMEYYYLTGKGIPVPWVP